MSQFWKVFSPLRCISGGDRGAHSSSQARSPPQPPPTPQASPHPPGSRSGTRCSTCCGLWFSASPRCSPTRCRPAPQGWSQGLQAGPGRSGCARAHPKPGLRGDRPQPLPSLGTNCDVTPTSKVAKTGEWSLVTMSSVQPGWQEGLLKEGPKALGSWAALATPGCSVPGVSLTIGVTDHVGLWV